MLDKVYKNEDEFCGICDNFNFKVTIFYDKSQSFILLLNIYIHGASIMLSSQAQTYHNANYGYISTFD